MNKDELKDLLFNVLNENDKLFSNISLNDEAGTIFIKSVNGKWFIVTVSPMTADEALIELWAKKNLELMSVLFGVTYMRDFGILTEEANKYLSGIIEKVE